MGWLAGRIVPGFKLEVDNPCGKLSGSCAVCFLVASAGTVDRTTLGVGRPSGVVVGAPSTLDGVARVNRTHLPSCPIYRTASVGMGTVAYLLCVIAKCGHL